MKNSKQPLHIMVILTSLALASALQGQTFSVLYNMGIQTGDPAQVRYPGIVAQGQDGNLYSTAPAGGAANVGAIYRVTPQGELTTIYSFDTTHGAQPFSGMTLGADGNFYGAAFSGSAHGCGNVFRVTSAGVLTILYEFSCAADGANPYSPPILASDGNFYGTTEFGGVTSGYGTVYKLTPAGKLTTIYKFDFNHGAFPIGPLVQGVDGNFYGTTYGGGGVNGAVFKLSAKGKISLLYAFNRTDGGAVYAGLVQGYDGNLYGATNVGGPNDRGVVFKISTKGKLTALHNFNYTDGSNPFSALEMGADGNFYGTAFEGGGSGCGDLYSVTPKGAFSVLANLDCNTAAQPMASMAQHTTGLFYGAAFGGGTGSGGIFYSLNTGAGPFVSLVETTGTAGTTVGVLGQGFSGATNVSFAGVSAQFSVVSDTFLTAIVPDAAGVGPASVNIASGQLVSKQIYYALPAIKAFSPSSGPVGTSVTITGTGLAGATKVAFNKTAANFTVTSGTQITATVPAGATSGKISVTTPGGVAASSSSFTVTP